MIADDQLRQIEESLLHYAHDMHEYTLQLWTDSRKAAEEKKGMKGHKSGEIVKRKSKLHEAKPRIVDLSSNKPCSADGGGKSCAVEGRSRPLVKAE